MNNQSFDFDNFKKGLLVFKITAKSAKTSKTRDYDMVNTYEDYVNRWMSHHPTPLLGEIAFERRLAYLFGCLNVNGYMAPRDETFTFWTRDVGSDEWKFWFNVEPMLYDIL